MKHNPRFFYLTHAASANQFSSRGMSLVEILVGLAIGLLVAAIALSTMQLSQYFSATVSESTSLRQDANTAMRIIGLQIRQSGSVALNLQPTIGSNLDSDALRPVIFESVLTTGGQTTAATADAPAVSAPTIAKSLGDTLRLQYENYAENLFDKSGVSTLDSQQRDCLGQNTSNRSLSPNILSTFFLRDGNLMCTGVAGTPQPIVSNVTDFSIRLVVSKPRANAKEPLQLQYILPTQIDGTLLRWEDVRSVEICFELTSPSFKVSDVGATYQKCNDQIKPKRDKLILVSRQIFNIRPQGT